MELTVESVENDENIFAVSFGCRAPVATCTQFPTWRKKLTSVVLRSWFSGQNKVFSRNQIVNISSIDLSNVTAPYSAEGFAFASRFHQEIWQFLGAPRPRKRQDCRKKRGIRVLFLWIRNQLVLRAHSTVYSEFRRRLTHTVALFLKVFFSSWSEIWHQRKKRDDGAEEKLVIINFIRVSLCECFKPKGKIES